MTQTIDSTEKYIQTCAIADQIKYLHIEKNLPSELPLLRRVKAVSDLAYESRLMQDIIYLTSLGKMPEIRIIWEKATELQQMSESDKDNALLAYAKTLGPKE